MNLERTDVKACNPGLAIAAGWLLACSIGASAGGSHQIQVRASVTGTCQMSEASSGVTLRPLDDGSTATATWTASGLRCTKGQGFTVMLSGEPGEMTASGEGHQPVGAAGDPRTHSSSGTGRGHGPANGMVFSVTAPIATASRTGRPLEAADAGSLTLTFVP